MVTNEDYQKHYLSIDDQRADMEDALSAAFGGNAILFVGSGMGEDDLLRPLRQFVGDHVPRSRRLAIAIVPADKKGGDRAVDLEKLRSLQRYGVYTIHTGNAGFERGEPKPSKGVSVRWLSRVAELRRRLDDVLNPKRSGTVETCCRAVTKWMSTAFKAATLAVPTSLEGVRISDYPALDLRHELVLFNTVIGFVRKDLKAIRQGEPPQDTPTTALRYALDGSMDSIVGAFLCARLIRAKRDEAEFISEWLRIPEAENPTRVVRETLDALREKAERKKKPWDSRKPLWVRHGVNLGEPPRAMTDDSGPILTLARPDRTVTAEKSMHWRRFYGRAPSQTFNHLLRCFAGEAAQRALHTPPEGRRLFVFVGLRGVGKGSFFSLHFGQQSAGGPQECSRQSSRTG